MVLKELLLKTRINSANGQINISLPKKKLSLKELDSIQKKQSIKLLMEDNE